MRQQVDYPVCYRALDLAPGALLSEIEDQGRFLRAAFHPDKFQGRLKEQATEKIKTVNIAIDELKAYWKTYGTAPPGLGPIARPAPKPEAPRPEPRPEPKPEPKAEPRPNTDNGNAPGANPAYDHANHLAVIGGYRGTGSYHERLLDGQWWKCLWAMLELPYGKMGRHEVVVHNDRIIIQTYAHQWEQLMCVLQIAAGLKLDDHFKLFFARTQSWRDSNVQIVSFAAQQSKEPPPPPPNDQSATASQSNSSNRRRNMRRRPRRPS